MILETIITSVNEQGNVHVTPFGIHMENNLVVISPYKPSVTLSNILAKKCAVMNLTDDVRVFAAADPGCVGRRHPWLSRTHGQGAMGFDGQRVLHQPCSGAVDARDPGLHGAQPALDRLLGDRRAGQ